MRYTVQGLRFKVQAFTVNLTPYIIYLIKEEDDRTIWLKQL